MQNNINIALSRLTAQERTLDVNATNIANASTPGFHAERMVFADWLVRLPQGAAPPGGQTISYTQDRTTYRDSRPGPMSHTGNPLDIAIGDTEGFFTVQTPAGPRLTRAAHFELNSTGQIVDNAGNALLDTQGRPMQVSTGDANLTVTGDGTITSPNGQIGRIGVVKPPTQQDLKAEGGHLFSIDVPTVPVTAPKLMQGAIEESNVQPVLELTRMMNDLRAYQFVGQFVQAEADRHQGAIDKITQKRT